MLDLQEQYVCDDIQKAVISQSVFHFLVENLFTGSVYIKYQAFTYQGVKS